VGRRGSGPNTRERESIKRHRATAYRYVPNRDETDAISGETFEGFDAMKLAAELLESPDLMPRRSRAAYMPNGPQVRTLPTDFTLFREHIVGEAVQSGNIVDLAWQKVANKPNLSNLGGKVNANSDVEWGNKSVPKTAITGVDWRDVDGKPSIPTKQQVEKWAEAAAKKAVKK